MFKRLISVLAVLIVVLSAAVAYLLYAPKPALPQTVFQERRVSRFNWNFSMDGAGQHFVLVLPPAKVEEEQPAPITVIVNWAAGLGKK